MTQEPDRRRPLLIALGVLGLLLLLLLLWLGYLLWTRPAAPDPVLREMRLRNAELQQQVADLGAAATPASCRFEDGLFPREGLDTLPPRLSDRLAELPVQPSELAPSEDVRDRIQEPGSRLDALLAKGTVLVLSGQSLDTVASSGSGFFVSPKLIVTNAHVVEEQSQVFIANDVITTPIAGRVIAKQAESAGHDFALIELAEAPSGIEVLPLAEVRRTERVYASGYPAFFIDEALATYLSKLTQGQTGLPPQGVVTDGIITSVQAGASLTRLPHTAALSPGNSGGPLADMCGRVVGINTYIMHSSEGGLMTRGDFALGARDIATFVEEQGLHLPVLEDACVPAPLATTPSGDE